MYNLHIQKLKLFIPFLLIGAVGVWIAIALMLCQASTFASSFVLISYMVVVAIGYGIQHSVKISLIETSLIAGFIAAGVALGIHAHTSILSAQTFIKEHPRDDIVVRVSSYPVAKDKNFRSEAVILNRDYIVSKVHLTSKEPLQNGSILAVQGIFKPYAEGEKAFLVRRGFVGQVKVFETSLKSNPALHTDLLTTLHDYLIGAIEPSSSKARALLAACVLGDKTEAKAQGLTQAFSDAGLAHVLAVSGAHLVVLMYVIEQTLLKVKLVPFIRCMLLTCSSGVFVLLCSAPISAVRAWIMYLLVALAKLYGRRISPITTLSVFVFLELIYNPLSAVDIGFCFSVIAVASLTIFAGPFNALFNAWLLRLLDYINFKRVKPKRVLYRMNHIINIITSSLVVMLMSAPLSIGVFGVIHPLGFISNIVVGPLFVPYLQVGFLALLTTPIPYVSDGVLALSDIIGTLFVWLVETLSHIDYMSMPFTFTNAFVVCLFVTFCILIYKKPGVIRYSCLAVIFCYLGYISYVRIYWTYWAPARIVMMDVDQGDGILLQEGSTTILIDAGPPNQLVDALNRNHVYEIDAAFITHLDLDHYAGILELQGHVACRRVYVVKGAKEHLPDSLRDAVYELTGEDVVEVTPFSSFKMGSFSFRCIWPQEVVSGDDNEHSFIMYMTYEQQKPFKIFFTGDCEAPQINQALERHPQKVDILKVGHHGSKKSTDASLLEILKPKHAIISCGLNNDYGHPSKDCLDALQKAKVKTYATCWMGDISIYPHNTGYTIEVQKDMDIQTRRRAA